MIENDRTRAAHGNGADPAPPPRLVIDPDADTDALHEAADALQEPDTGALREAADALQEDEPETVDADLHDELDPAELEDPSAAIVHLDDPVEVLPLLVRAGTDIWLRAVSWGLGASVRASFRLAQAAADPEAAAELYEDVRGGIRSYAREFLGITELDEQVRELHPLAGAIRPGTRRPQLTLRAQGEELLRRAADVEGPEDPTHPAFARILTELAPDEARILRVLWSQGPQPIVDIRAANLIGMGSQLVSANQNMLGPQAGLRQRDRVPEYLGNLQRLGLVDFSDDALQDAIAYQVLEAQPEVLETIKETPRARSVHRSIVLTPFGKAFCAACLPADEHVPAPDGSLTQRQDPGEDHG